MKPRTATPAALPEFVEPMKAKLVASMPAGDWIYEVKFDGYRALAIRCGPETRLLSRNQKELSKKFPEIVDTIAALDVQDAIVDGLGEHQEREVLEARVALLWQNQNRANTCPKKKQSKRAIDRRMVQENDFMELNHKLTHLLKGRTILSESGDEGHVAITFDEQSTLKLRVAGQATVSVGAKVEAVHEAGGQFRFDLEEGARAVYLALSPSCSAIVCRSRYMCCERILSPST